VRTPSQSTSMSAVQKNADPCLQMFTVDDSPSSVAYYGPARKTSEPIDFYGSTECRRAGRR
jgi:hypothetical protein